VCVCGCCFGCGGFVLVLLPFVVSLWLVCPPPPAPFFFFFPLITGLFWLCACFGFFLVCFFFPSFPESPFTSPKNALSKG